MASKDDKLSVRRQCPLLTLTNLYYEPKGESAENLRYKAIIHCPTGALLPRGDKPFLTRLGTGHANLSGHFFRKFPAVSEGRDLCSTMHRR